MGPLLPPTVVDKVYFYHHLDTLKPSMQPIKGLFVCWYTLFSIRDTLKALHTCLHKVPDIKQIQKKLIIKTKVVNKKKSDIIIHHDNCTIHKIM